MTQRQQKQQIPIQQPVIKCEECGLIVTPKDIAFDSICLDCVVKRQPTPIVVKFCAGCNEEITDGQPCSCQKSQPVNKYDRVIDLKDGETKFETFRKIFYELLDKLNYADNDNKELKETFEEAVRQTKEYYKLKKQVIDLQNQLQEQKKKEEEEKDLAIRRRIKQKLKEMDE